MAQEHIRASFFSDAIDASSVHVHLVEGRESLGRLFEFDVVLVTTDGAGLPVPDLLDRSAALVFTKGDETVRTVRGVIAEVEDLGQTDGAVISYRLKLVPRAWVGTLNRTLDVHLDTTVPDLVQKKLLANGVDAARVEMRLGATYPTRDFVVQYKETDHAFWSRLLEHWGITLFFEEDEEDVRVVLGDDNSAFGQIRGGAPIPYQGAGDHSGVHDVRSTSRPVPKRYVVRDYNYRTPTVDLWAYEDATVPGTGREAAEYGTHFKTPEEGAFFAKVRAQEALCRQTVFTARSSLVEMRAGGRFLLEGHPKGDVELLVTEVRHHLRQVALQGSAGDVGYRNELTAIPAAVPFRPERTTPVPKVSGVLTGRVETSAASNYAELDEDGRYKVRFLFDAAESAKAQASHPVRMMQPHSGPGYGMHFPLRAGIEVALTFVDGDPDRPVIVGTVPNAATGNPVTSSNNTKNVIRTGGGNYIDIDDKSDSERIKLGTPRLNTILQLGAPNAGEDGVLTSTLGNSSTIANTSISGITSLQTSVTLFQKLSSAGDIISFASKPSAKEKAMMGLSLVDTVASIGTTALDVTQKVMAAVQAQKDGDAQVAAFAVDEANGKAAAANQSVDDRMAALAADTSIPQATRDALAAKKAAFDDAQKELAAANSALATVQDAYNDLKNKKDIMGLAVDGAILAKRTELVAAWAAVLKAQEKLDGDTALPADASLEPIVYADSANDVAKSPPSDAAQMRTQAVFTAAGGDASVDVAKDLADALAALPNGKGATANVALTSAGVAMAEQQSAIKAYAGKKREAGWGALNNTQGESAKNVAKASLALNAARTGTALISAIMGFFNLAKSTEEQVKNDTTWAKLGAQLTTLGLKTLATPGTQYAAAGFCPPQETTNLSGSEGSMGLYAYERLFQWSPDVAVLGDRVMLSAGDVPDFAVTPPAFQVPKSTAVYLDGAAGTVELRADEALHGWSKNLILTASPEIPTAASPIVFHRLYADQAEAMVGFVSKQAQDHSAFVEATTKTNAQVHLKTQHAAKITELDATEGAVTLKGTETIAISAGDKAKLDLAKADAKVELSADAKGMLTMKSDSTVTLKNDKDALLEMSASAANLTFGGKGLAIGSAKTEVTGAVVNLTSDGNVDVKASGQLKVSGAKVLLG